MLQAPPQKIDLQGLAADFALQFGDPRLLLSPLAVASKCLESVIAQFASPAVQNIGVHFAGSRHFGDSRTQFQASDRSFLKLFRKLPSRQSHDSNLHLTKIES